MPISRLLSWAHRRQRIESSASTKEQEARLAHGLQMAMDMHRSGRYEKSETVYRDVLLEARGCWGENSSECITVMSNLGLCLKNQHRLKEAEACLQEAVDTSGRVLGLKHTLTLVCHHNLATVLMEQRSFVQAEKILRRVISASIQEFGVGDHRVVTSKSILAVCLKSQGGAERLKEAETLEISVFRSRRRGDVDETRVIRSLAAVGRTLCQQGKLHAAERVQLKVLQLTRQANVQDTEVGVRAMNDLACTYWRQNRNSDAETLFRSALQTTALVFGPEHPEHLRIARNLADVLTDQGKLEIARKVRTASATFGA